MEWITHTATGFFIGQALVTPEQRPRRSGWWWSMAAISPDWLELLTRWLGDIHRGVTHSLYLWPFLALAWALSARRWGGRQTASLWRLWLVFAAIIGSHLFLDVLMPYRWYLAWPFSHVHWAWDIMPFYDVYIFAGWLVLLVANRRWKLPSVLTAKIGLAVFLAVFAIRAGGKVRAHALAKQVLAHSASAAAVRTIPAYYRPWIWYLRMPNDRFGWRPINLLTGRIVPGMTGVNPVFPPLPTAILKRLRRIGH